MGTGPKPEVVYLPALFRAIRRGEIRVPAFQRGLVWEQPDVIRVLESVYRSYPIGSLLFWHVEESVMRTDFAPDLPFPHPATSGIVDFVLDGMQRLSALYGAFHERGNMAPRDDIFAIAFNLRMQRFVSFRDWNNECFLLRDLFIPRAMLEAQARLGGLIDGDMLVERSLDLQRAFQEYLVPVVRIGSRSVEEVVEIFERVNTSGTRLSAVDFMRALTWSNNFDLNEKLNSLAQMEELAGFNIPSDTFAKAIALTMSVPPTSDEMIGLRSKDSSELEQAVVDTRDALRRVADFLHNEFSIRSYDFVPYEGQFLVMVSAAAGSAPLPAWLKQWFWTVGFSEAMQGRTDHALARMAIDARNKPLDKPKVQFNIDVQALQTKAVRRGASLAMTTIAAMAITPACSVFDGRQLVAEDFTSAFDPTCLAPVFSLNQLGNAVSPAPRSQKLICNVVLLSPEERRGRPRDFQVRDAVLSLAGTPGGMDALKTQCIDEDCVAAIRDRDPKSFLQARAAAIVRMARVLCG